MSKGSSNTTSLTSNLSTLIIIRPMNGNEHITVFNGSKSPIFYGNLLKENLYTLFIEHRRWWGGSLICFWIFWHFYINQRVDHSTPKSKQTLKWDNSAYIYESYVPISEWLICWWCQTTASPTSDQCRLAQAKVEVNWNGERKKEHLHLKAILDVK